MHGRFAVALVVALTAGCHLAGGGAVEPASYFPMEADRVWEYRLEDLARAAAWPVAVRSRGPRFVPELGRIAAIFEEAYGDHVVPVAFYLAEGFVQTDIGLATADGRRRGPASPGTQPMRVLPVPPRIGTRWAYSEEIFGGAGHLPATFVIHWEGDVEAIEDIEVPAGRFRGCVRVVSVALHELDDDARAIGYRYVDWYAPDVGLVKSEYADGSNGRTITRLELVRHYRDRVFRSPDPALLRLAAGNG